MEKRVVVAVILSIAVLYGYSFIFPPPQKPGAGKAVTALQSNPSSARIPATSAATTQLPAQGTKSQPAISPRDVVVETDLYRAVFNTQGACLKSFVLKKYKENSRTGSPDVVLINQALPSKSFMITEAKNFGIGSELVYSANRGSLVLAGNQKDSLEFTAVTPSGVAVTKTYTFKADGYAIEVRHQLSNAGGGRIDGNLHLLSNNQIVSKEGDSRFEVYGPVVLAEDKVTTEKIADVAKEPKLFDKSVQWAAFGDKYFINAVIAEKGSIASVRLAKLDNNLVEDISTPALALAPGQTASVGHKLFLGPKDLEILKQQGSRLEEVIDLGWFSALAKPLLQTLKFFYSFTHNYGIAIIIITVILKVLFFPLTHKSYKSMKEMQKLQPKMNALKEKHKNDRDAMNRAVMELYKTHKVNPMGGCLPMLVQIPVFFALYKALMFSIELRHAPFLLWITDLSAKDPYYVTPIIMGITMFVQQKMTPTNADPVQAKMMLALPVVFTFMFLNFPSGLVLYWLVNNILTIAQQAYINKSLPA